MKNKADHALPSGTETAPEANQRKCIPPHSLMRLEAIPIELLFPGAALKIIERIKGTGLPLLIIGERGLCQKYLATILHNSAPFAGGQFFEIFPPHLDKTNLHSQIYGRTAEPCFAQGIFKGTIFIHAIEDATQVFQGYVQRILEEQQIEIPGGNQIPFKGRIIAYSVKTLEHHVTKGKFLDTLYYRLNVACTYLKPLRERRDDIAEFAQIFLHQCTKQLNLPQKNFTPEALQCMQDFHWPGNLPELQSVVYRSALFSTSSTVDSKDILFAGTPKEDICKKGIYCKSVPNQTKVSSPSHLGSLAKENAVSCPYMLSIENLVAEFSHEIKNPLVAIKTFTQLLPGHINDPEFQSGFFSIAEKSIERIDYLIERMLEFSKFSQPVPSVVHLPALIRKVFKNLDKYAIKDDICYEDNAPDERSVPPVYIDPEQFCYALENILLYSIQHKDNNQKVNLLLSKSSESTSVHISYIGSGDLKGAALHAKDENNSTIQGLDLFLSFQILSNNKIILDKSNDDRRTTFHIRLPLVKKDKIE